MGAKITLWKNYDMETNQLGDLIPDDMNAYTYSALIDCEGGNGTNTIVIHGLVTNEETARFYKDWFNTRDGDDMREAASAAIAYDNVNGTKRIQAQAILQFIMQHMMDD